MRNLIASCVVGAALAALFPAGSVAGEVRGRVQDFRRARALTVAYTPGRQSAAQHAARSLGFRVSRNDARNRLFRCTWSNLDLRALEAKVRDMARAPGVQVVTPDPTRE